MSERTDSAPPSAVSVPSGTQVTRWPLSVGQRGLWFIHRLEPESSAYNTMLAVRISTPLDEYLLRKAVSVMALRHEMLRSTFTEVSGQPWRQTGTPEGEGAAALSVHDAHGLGVGELYDRVRELGEKPFRLAEGARAFRIDLLRLGHDESVLLLAAHHIVIDASSLYLVLGELLSVYRGIEEGLPVLGHADFRPYDAFVTAEQELLDGPRGARRREYWRAVCSGAAPAQLPQDRLGRTAPDTASATHTLHTSADFLTQVASAAAAARTTPFVHLLAAFQACLHRHTRQEDFLVGVPVAIRRSPDHRRLIGYLVNSLPIRSGCTESTTFADMVGSARQRMTRGLSNMEYPFPLMAKEFRSGAEHRRAPLFRITFSMLPVNRTEPALPMPKKGEVEGTAVTYAGHRIAFMDVPQQEGQFDLAVELRYGADSLSGTFRYDSSLFDRSTIESLANRFVRFARIAAAEPDTRVHDAPLLDRAEASQLFAFGQV